MKKNRRVALVGQPKNHCLRREKEKEKEKRGEEVTTACRRIQLRQSCSSGAEKSTGLQGEKKREREGEGEGERGKQGEFISVAR